MKVQRTYRFFWYEVKERDDYTPVLAKGDPDCKHEWIIGKEQSSTYGITLENTPFMERLPSRNVYRRKICSKCGRHIEEWRNYEITSEKHIKEKEDYYKEAINKFNNAD